MAKSVKIANPVYDTVFKLLMQDLRITKFLIGVISDNKYKSGTIYAAFVVSQTDYLAYGQAMPDRSFNTTAIRYTFNGKEDEIFSEWQDYGFRNYDKKQRRFTSVDPLTAKYPWYTPYQFAGNKVILFVDIDGLEEGQFSEKIKYGFQTCLEFYAENEERLDGALAVVSGILIVKTGVALCAVPPAAGLGVSAIIYGTGQITFGGMKFGDSFNEKSKRSKLLGASQNYTQLIGHSFKNYGFENAEVYGYWLGEVLSFSVSSVSALNKARNLIRNPSKLKADLPKKWTGLRDFCGKSFETHKNITVWGKVSTITTQVQSMATKIGYDMFIAENSSEKIANLESLETKIKFIENKTGVTLDIIYEAKDKSGNIIWKKQEQQTIKKEGNNGS